MRTGNIVLLSDNPEGESIDLHVVVRAKVSWLFEVGMGLLTGGLIVMLGGGTAVFFALRNKKSKGV